MLIGDVEIIDKGLTRGCVAFGEEVGLDCFVWICRRHGSEKERKEEENENEGMNENECNED